MSEQTGPEDEQPKDQGPEQQGKGLGPLPPSDSEPHSANSFSKLSANTDSEQSDQSDESLNQAEDVTQDDQTNQSEAIAESKKQKKEKLQLPAALRLIAWLSRLMLMAVCLTLLAIVALLWRPPEYMLNWVAAFVENLLLDQTGLPLKIGRIAVLEVRPMHQRLVLENVYLYGHKDARLPFVVTPYANLETDLVAYFLGQPQVTMLELGSPQLRVIRDLEGRINFRPEFKPSDPNAPKGEPMDLPRAKLSIRDLVVLLRNESDDFRISDHVHVPHLNADLHDSNIADLYGLLRTDLFTFASKSQLQVYTGLGWATGKVASVDLDNINQYTRMVRGLNIQSGAFTGELWANWNDYSFQDLR